MDGRDSPVDPETDFERPATPVVARFDGESVLPGERFGCDAPVVIRPEYVDPAAATVDRHAGVERVTREDATWRIVLAWSGERVRPGFPDDLLVGLSA